MRESQKSDCETTFDGAATNIEEEKKKTILRMLEHISARKGAKYFSYPGQLFFFSTSRLSTYNAILAMAFVLSSLSF